MAFDAAGILDKGQLAATITDIYVCPAGHTANVRVHLSNTDAAVAYAYNLYARKAGDSVDYRLSGNGKTLAAGADVALPDTDGTFVLAAGDKLRGSAATAAKIDYVVMGGTSLV